MGSLLATTHDITVTSAPASSGLTLSSGLVFAGGLIAGLAAVLAAVLTARAAERRLERTLGEERDREIKRIAAESDRIDRQLSQERFLVERAEASEAIEKAARLIARNQGYLRRMSRRYVRDGDGTDAERKRLRGYVIEIREEMSVLSLRFGAEAAVVEALTEVILAFSSSIPERKELPLSEAKKKELGEAQGEMDSAVGEFLAQARLAVADYVPA